MEAASAVTPMKISEVSGGCRHCSGSGPVAPGRTLDLRHITSNDIKSTLRIYTSLYIPRKGSSVDVRSFSKISRSSRPEYYLATR